VAVQLDMQVDLRAGGGVARHPPEGRNREFEVVLGAIITAMVLLCRRTSSSDNADVSYFNAIGTSRSFEKVHII
jgi:hypothetical protein